MKKNEFTTKTITQLKINDWMLSIFKNNDTSCSIRIANDTGFTEVHLSKDELENLAMNIIEGI